MQKTCVIIPCYNEGKRLPIDIFEQYLKHNPINFCFVDDGSTDNTYEILTNLKDKFREQILVIKNPVNAGKAKTVRNGILEALKWKEFDYVGFFDADLATPLNEIEHFLSFLRSGKGYKFALGSRIRRLGSNIERTLIRHIFGRIFATFASLILNLPVYDTQCGAKIIDRKVAEDIFRKPLISKWLFDIELIARVKIKYSPEILVEVPLNKWAEIGDTKIKFRDIIKFPLELIKIRRKYQ